MYTNDLSLSIYIYIYILLLLFILAQDLPRSCVQTEAVGELTVSGLKQPS